MSRLFRTLAIDAKANVSSETFLRWTIGLTVGAWVVAVGAMLSGVASPMLGMTLLSMIATGLAFVVLLASQNSAEPAVSSRQEEFKPEPVPAPAPARVAVGPNQRLVAQSKAPARASTPSWPSAPTPAPAPARVPAPAPAPVAPPVRRELMTQSKPAELMVLSRGLMEGREYAIFADGSIELETAFGPRWFASIEIAHEFIGFRNGAPLRLAASDLDLGQVA
jgi:hypothetical protein